MKDVVMSAHDAILETRVKQARSANCKQQVALFIVGDLAYVSTKNLSLPKGQAWKLVPKFIGPYKLVRDFRNNSFKLDLPPRLRQRGIHPVFIHRYFGHTFRMMIAFSQAAWRHKSQTSEKLSQNGPLSVSCPTKGAGQMSCLRSSGHREMSPGCRMSRSVT
jgi:hypothetical protein